VKTTTYNPRDATAYTERRTPASTHIARLMREHGWNHRDRQLRRRLYDIAASRPRWWQWWKLVTPLVASSHGMNDYDIEPPTWWYVRAPHATQRYTGFPRRRYEVVTDYHEFRRRTDGLDEDAMYDWNAISVDQDGDLILGKRYWGGQFYGLDYAEVEILRRYLRMWHRFDWFGLRSWLSQQALHASANEKIPFTCQALPPAGSGGHSHWHCGEKRGHAGDHRFRNYTWPNA